MRSLDKVISAEISFSPLESGDYVKDIDRVLGLIDESGLDYQVGMMSTLVIGKAKEIFQLLEGIYEKSDEACGFTFHVTISNRCLECQR